MPIENHLPRSDERARGESSTIDDRSPAHGPANDAKSVSELENLSPPRPGHRLHLRPQLRALRLAATGSRHPAGGEKVESAANTYMDQLNVLMMTGAIANRQIVQTKLKSEAGIVEARLIRAPAVTSLFGPGHPDQQIEDKLDERAINQGETILEQRGNQLTLIKPFKAYKEYRGTQCTTCHQVAEGTVMGACASVTISATPLARSIATT